MTLTHLAIGIVLTLAATLLFGGKKRGFFLFIISILAVYALQPALPIRYTDFFLPTAALGLALVTWNITTPSQERFKRENLFSVAWLITLILLLGLTRFLPFEPILTASVPPRFRYVLISLAALIILPVLSGYAPPKISLPISIFGFIVLLLLLKTPEISLEAARLLRSWNQQAVESASALDIRWIGFSYIAFRLIHTLVDSLKGRLPGVSLQEYITFIFFYPALVAGPIDRLERFIKDLRAPFNLKDDDWDFIIQRLTYGLLKKYILADSLALIALDPKNAGQIQFTGWAWVLLYFYAFRIFLDFSGYTDIARALGRLAGVHLPENFNKPYLKPNLTQFWNNWHMSLTQWFRAYVFNPLTRALRGTPMPVWAIILLTQIVTMTLIGLWHGVTLNFLFWGLWHGLGLFIHNRWQNAFRVKVEAWASSPVRRVLANFSGGLLTFHFVALGWVWFVLPDPASAIKFFALLIPWK